MKNGQRRSDHVLEPRPVLEDALACTSLDVGVVVVDDHDGREEDHEELETCRSETEFSHQRREEMREEDERIDGPIVVMIPLTYRG